MKVEKNPEEKKKKKKEKEEEEKEMCLLWLQVIQLFIYK